MQENIYKQLHFVYISNINVVALGKLTFFQKDKQCAVSFCSENNAHNCENAMNNL